MARLADHYSVGWRFQRATRIDHDSRDETALDGFVLHATGRQIVDRLFDRLVNSQQRAFTWTGPYGSGKSTLALFLCALLGGNIELRAAARKRFGKRQLERLCSSLPEAGGNWLVLRVVGEKTDPHRAIASALRPALEEFFEGKVPRALKKDLDPKSPRELLDILHRCAGKAAQRSGGLLLVIDEMGKFFDHAAEGKGDLHFFQELAEEFGRWDEVGLLVGILHQSFQVYAGRLDRGRRDEWSKIQGRFEDIPFTVTIEESLELIGRAISAKTLSKQAPKLVGKVVRALKSGRLKGYPELKDQLTRCYPLHPLSALILPPISRERFGQNERSIFSFLSSGEPGGFKDFLLSTPDRPRACFAIDRLWDYLQLNLQQTILASPIGHKWSEVSEALVRAESGGETHLRITKAVGLLDLFGRPFSLNATEDLILTAFPDLKAVEVKATLRDLAKWSVLVYRRHLGAWGITAGSDVDIDQEVEQATAEIAADTEAILRDLPEQTPIVAKRHYHEKGTFRWFEVGVVSPRGLEELLQETSDRTADGVFALVVSDNSEEPHEAVRDSTKQAGTNRIVVAALDPSQGKLLSISREFAALKRVVSRVPEVQTDAVARREVQARMSLVAAQLEREISLSLESAEWSLSGESLGTEISGGLSRIASELCDRVFDQAPVLKNELINRFSPSSHAVAARRVLMHHMVLFQDHENLRIEKHPPELGLYLSLLRANKLHIFDAKQGIWRFARPARSGDSKYLLGMWNSAHEIFKRSLTTGEPVPLSELYAEWSKPPFGLRDGVMPILALSYFLANSHEVALYIEGMFTPALDDFVVDLMLQDPTQVSVRIVKMTGVRREVLAQLATLSEAKLKGSNADTALEIAKQLVTFAHRLHPWVKRTKQLSKETRAVRHALLSSSDPHALLFRDLPAACGLSGGIKSKADAEKLVKKLDIAISELKSAYDRLLDNLKETCCRVFGLPDSSAESLALLQERAELIAHRSGDFLLDALILRFGEALSKDTWIEGLAALVMKKPPRSWTDNDVLQAQVEIGDFAQRFDRVYRFLQANGEIDRGQAFSLFMAKAGGELSEYSASVELTAAESEKVAPAVRQSLSALRNAGLGTDARLAVLAGALRAELKDRTTEKGELATSSEDEQEVA